MALRQVVKHIDKRVVDRSSVITLYRSCMKEIPRVLTIYDIDMPVKTAQNALAFAFRKNAHVTDGKIIGILLAKGYMELEETLLQWKQKTHLMRILEPTDMMEKEAKPLTAREKIIKGYEYDD